MTSDWVFVGQMHNYFLLLQDNNMPNNVPDHASFYDWHADEHKCICYLNNVDNGQENDNCVGLKLAKTLAKCKTDAVDILAWLYAGCKIGP